MKKKVIKLEVPPEKSLYYAVSCQNPMHKLAWHINSDLSLQLKQSDGIQVGNALFPSLRDEETNLEFTTIIIQNKVETNILARELPNIDYIIKFQGNINAHTAKKLVGRIKETEAVMAVIPIDPHKIKSISILQNI